MFDERRSSSSGRRSRTVFAQLQPRRLFVLDCDTRVTQVQCLSGERPLSWAPSEAVVARVSVRRSPGWTSRESAPAFLVYLTDMHGKFPPAPPAYPTLWASTTPLHTIPPPFGEAVEVIV
ncbi:VWA-like domain-containing protein [Cupriavidus basilensis]